MRKYIIISIGIFLISFFVGYAFVDNLGINLDKADFSHVDSAAFFRLLYINGSVCMFLILGMGIVTAPLGFYQGLQLGGIIALFIKSENNMSNLVLLTLPHCIFEIPALIISIGLGLKLASLLIQYYRHQKIEVKAVVCKLHGWFISVPILLFVAALIEAFITGWLFNIINS